MKYNFELKCPRCNKDSTMTLTKVAKDNVAEYPRVNCGDCLYNDIEVVELTIVRVHVSD